MTLSELHIAIDLELDKTMDFDSPYVSPEQKDYWLNKAQERFVKSRAFGNNPKQTTFEEDQKRIDDLRTLVKPAALTPANTSGTLQITLPNDYMYLVRHECSTSSSNYGSRTVGGRQVKQDEINLLRQDPFRKSSPLEPLYYLMGNTLVYETPVGFTIPTCQLIYLKKPARIQYGTQYAVPQADTACELPEHTHAEIVDLAVTMLLENLESGRYQTNLNESIKSE